MTAESTLAAARNSLDPEELAPAPTPAQLLAKNILLSIPAWAEDAEDGSIILPKGTITQLQDKMGIPSEQRPFYRQSGQVFPSHYFLLSLLNESPNNYLQVEYAGVRNGGCKDLVEQVHD